jgi:hypothetical protein
MNNWREIVKAKGKLSAKTGLTTDLRENPLNKPDKNCLEKIKEYADYLKNHTGFLMSIGQSKYADEDGKRDSGKFGKYYEQVISRFNPIPEPVACKLLSMIESKKYDNQGPTYRSVKVDNEEWICGVVFDTDWDELDLAPYGSDYEDIQADAGFMAFAYIKNKHIDTKSYPIMLRHMAQLYKNFDAGFEAEIIREIDWRDKV